MRHRAATSAALVILLAACASQPMQDSSESKRPDAVALARPDLARPFVGLWLSDAKDGGALVDGLQAGPGAAAGVLPGDRILRIGEVEVNAQRVLALMSAASPGTRMRLHILRGDKPLQIDLVVDSRERWATPAAYPARVTYAAMPVSDSGQGSDSALTQVLRDAPEIAPIGERLDRMFLDLARHDGGYHKLPLMRTALMQPEAMTHWRDDLLAHMRSVTDASGPVLGVMCRTLALNCAGRVIDPRDSLPGVPPDTPLRISDFAAVIASANKDVREVFRGVDAGRARALDDLGYLLEKTAAERTLRGHPDALRGIRAMQLSMRVDLDALLAVAGRMLANAQSLPLPAKTQRQVPAALSAMVQGEIVDFAQIDGGYVVIGGPGANRYDMDRLYAVIETGGDDDYRWGNGVAPETQTVIDMQGNDRYVARRGGPAAGWLGVSLLIDRAGDDHYESALGGCGAGAMGFGLLFDAAGADSYQCAAWSLGAGIYGGGALIDRDTQSDVYISHTFSQGVGGPRGFGLLLDAGGADLYRANGPVPSAYDTPASYMGFSQGVGVGIRPYDSGGVGALIDLGGNDRYEGGEFSQGGGYFWGIGVLHDAAGNDLYYGNRYAQGFAAHQAFGMLSDMSGDDVYWSMAAAGQAAAWDQSIAMLYEGGGNDFYRADALGQGAAAQQSRASLHDVSGDDVYQAVSQDAQGGAGDNSYHFVTGDPIYSLGVLLDENGTDRYSTRLGNGERRVRAVLEDVINGMGVSGLAVDRP